MDGETQTKIYAQVLQGVSKESSAYVTDDESSAYWDQVSAEVETMRGKGLIFDVPSTPTFDLEEQGVTIEDMKRMQREHAESKGLPWPPTGADTASVAPTDTPTPDTDTPDPEPTDE